MPPLGDHRRVFARHLGFEPSLGFECDASRRIETSLVQVRVGARQHQPRADEGTSMHRRIVLGHRHRAGLGIEIADPRDAVSAGHIRIVGHRADRAGAVPGHVDMDRVGQATRTDVAGWKLDAVGAHADMNRRAADDGVGDR